MIDEIPAAVNPYFSPDGSSGHTQGMIITSHAAQPTGNTGFSQLPMATDGINRSGQRLPPIGGQYLAGSVILFITHFTTGLDPVSEIEPFQTQFTAMFDLPQ